MAKTDQPEDLRYAETHEWVRLEGDEATIGISDHAQDELGGTMAETAETGQGETSLGRGGRNPDQLFYEC